MKRLRQHIIFLVLVAALSGVVSARLADPKVTLEAAISYNLARFVSRLSPVPGEARTLLFCVRENTPIADELRVMQAARQSSQTLILREVATPHGFYSGCDLAFLSATDQKELSLEKLALVGTLTIGNTVGFLDAGGGIHLLQVGQKIGFSVNMAALKTAKKALSSRVLKLAKEVRTAP